jgi:PTS system cellobiose-specific IIB component
MAITKILLCCGAGMSSGFLAQRTRQAAKKRNIQIIIDARAESEVSDYLSSISMLLVGPHFASRISDFERMANAHNIPVRIIPQEIYAALNGDELLDLVLETITL